MLKKKWVTPQLIVLLKDKPEVDVLVACKIALTILGPDTKEVGCRDPYQLCERTCNEVGIS